MFKKINKTSIKQNINNIKPTFTQNSKQSYEERQKRREKKLYTLL